MATKNNYRIAQIEKNDGTVFYQLQKQPYGAGEWVSVYSNPSLDAIREAKADRIAKDEEFFNRNVTIIE